MDNHGEEILDVVNEHDEVTGQAPASLVHQQNSPHRSVHLLISDAGEKFLLQQASPPADSDEPGRWGASAFGHVAAGMHYDEAVTRKAGDQLGFLYEQPLPTLHVDASPETGYEWTLLYVHPLTPPTSLRPDEKIAQQLRWWTEQELVDALVQNPERFVQSFSILFFLWRESEFVVPYRMNDSTFAIDWDTPDRLHVKRAMLESAGIPASVSDDLASLVPGSRGGFFGKRDPATSGLCVPYENLTEAIALLYLSRPADA